MYKKHSSFSLIALLFVPRLSEHERSGAIGMLKAGMRVSGVGRTFKGRHTIGQLRMATDIKTATYVDYIDDIYIDDICSGMLPTLPDE